MVIVRSILLFLLAAFAEIGGAWLIWQGVRENRGLVWIGAGVIALLFPWLYLRGAERQTIRLYLEGPATGIFGDFSLALEQQGLRGSSEAGEQLVYWRAIYRISQTPDHAFIYLNPAVAIIIPRAKILSGPFEQFMHEIQSRAPQSNA